MNDEKVAFEISKGIGHRHASCSADGGVFVLLIRLDEAYLRWFGIVAELSIVAICMGFIASLQVVFGSRRIRRIALRTVWAVIILSLVVTYMVFVPDSRLYVPLRMLQGEGLWTRRIGEAHVEIGERLIDYDVYRGCERWNGEKWTRGKLMLIAHNPELLRREESLLRDMVLAPDAMFTVDVAMIHLPLLPTATVVRGGISLEPRWKAQMFDEMKITTASGVRRYECVFDPLMKTSDKFLCTVDEILFDHAKP